MTMTITDAQSDTMTKLVAIGYKVTNVYGDSIVRMALANGVSVFVRPNGSVTVPATPDTMVAGAALHEAGIVASNNVND